MNKIIIVFLFLIFICSCGLPTAKKIQTGEVVSPPSGWVEMQHRVE